MPAIRQSNLIVGVCEGAGVVGMAAALVVCSLAYTAISPLGFWIAAAISLAANLIYITHIFAQRVTGSRALNWRELVLATVVPVVALVVTAAMAGEIGGLFHLPFAGADGPAHKHVITISPDKGSD